MKTVSLVCLVVFSLFCAETGKAGAGVTLSLRQDRGAAVGDKVITLTLLAKKSEKIDIVAFQAKVNSPMFLALKSCASQIVEAQTSMGPVKSMAKGNHVQVIAYTMAKVAKQKDDLVLLSLVFNVDPNYKLKDGEVIDFLVDSIAISDGLAKEVKCNSSVNCSLIVGKSKLVKASK